MTIPYTRETWVDDTTSVTASRLNNLEVGVVDAHAMPAVAAYHNANQSISTSTATALAFNSERFDTAGGSASTMHDNSTNNSRLTCRHAGKYLIVAAVAWGAGSTGFREIRLRLNGTTEIARHRSTNLGASDGTIHSVSRHYDLAVNDYVEVVAWHNQGSSLNVLSSADYSPEFSMSRVG